MTGACNAECKISKGDLVAFIDEAGDEGSVSQWFVVSGIVMTISDYQRTREAITSFCQANNNKKLTNVSFKRMNHNQRKDLSALIGKNDYLTSHSVFHKSSLSEDEKYLNSYPSMYFVGVKNVIERISWIADHMNRGKVHIMIANRNSIKSEDLYVYLFQNSARANRNLTYFNKLGKVVLGTKQKMGMVIADCIASSMFQCLEPRGVAQVGEKAYFNLCLKRKLYNSKHLKYSGVWNNGLRCTPRNEGLIDGDILTEGSAS